MSIDLMEPNEASLEDNPVRAYMSFNPNDRYGAILNEVAKRNKRVSPEQENVSLPHVPQTATRVINVR